MIRIRNTAVGFFPDPDPAVPTVAYSNLEVYEGNIKNPILVRYSKSGSVPNFMDPQYCCRFIRIRIRPY
jgi:hypothetical protein